VVDVLVKKRIYATFRIEGVHPDTRTPVALRAHVLDRDTGKVISEAGPGREFRLGPGRYTIALWQHGYRLAKRNVQVTKEETFDWQIALKEAPRLTGKVVHAGGQPLHERVFLWVHYNDAPYLERQPGTQPKEDGTFALSVDDGLAPLLCVRLPQNTIHLTPIAPADVQAGVSVRLDPKTVTGDISIESGVGDGKRVLLMWTRKAFPRFILAGHAVEDARYEQTLEPGTYVRYITNGIHAVRLDEVEVTDKPTQTLPPVHVTETQWKEQKKPCAEFFDRL